MVLRKNLFDIYVGIDWSGAKSPIKSKSIALSWCSSGIDKPNFIKEGLSRQDVADWIIEFSKRYKRMLIGIDCNFGYADTVGQRQFGSNFKIDDLWGEVERYNYQNDNFYAGCFWESRKYKAYFWTSGSKPKWFDESMLRRQTEKICKDLKLGNPECPFKLIGPKQVGKGGLSGMRLAKYLSSHLGDSLSVWPFRSFDESSQIVLSEIYPRLFLNYCGFSNEKVRNFNDLNSILTFFKSKNITDEYKFNDHICDAIISSAGLRFFIERLSSSVAEAFYIDDKYLELAKNEGWIFGVNEKFLQKRDVNV